MTKPTVTAMQMHLRCLFRNRGHPLRTHLTGALVSSLIQRVLHLAITIDQRLVLPDRVPSRVIIRWQVFNLDLVQRGRVRSLVDLLLLLQ